MGGQYVWFQMNIEKESDAPDIDSLIGEREITDERLLNYLDEEDRKLQREIDEWQKRAIYHSAFRIYKKTSKKTSHNARSPQK